MRVTISRLSFAIIRRPVCLPVGSAKRSRFAFGALQRRLAIGNRCQQIAEQGRVAGESDLRRRGVFTNFEDLKLADFLNVDAEKAAFFFVNAFDVAARADDLEVLAFFNALL